MKKYVQRKRTLLKQLGICITEEQWSYMKNLKTEIAIDNFARKLILSDF